MSRLRPGSGLGHSRDDRGRGQPEAADETRCVVATACFDRGFDKGAGGIRYRRPAAQPGDRGIIDHPVDAICAQD